MAFADTSSPAYHFRLLYASSAMIYLMRGSKFAGLTTVCIVCRGRKERMAFADTFAPAYHFRLLYASSAMIYPIRGALRHVYGGPWEVRS